MSRRRVQAFFEHFQGAVVAPQKPEKTLKDCHVWVVEKIESGFLTDVLANSDGR
jgi:hypothetical protein